MGRELTKRYASVFERHVAPPVAMLGDVYRAGKLREAVSFVAWESAHRLHLFRPHHYLRFNAGEPVVLGDAWVNQADCDRRVAAWCGDQGLDVVRLDQPWRVLFVAGSVLWGSVDADGRDLWRSTVGGTATRVASFPERVKGIFVSSRGQVFVSVRGAVYKGGDGEPFRKVLQLGSPVSWFRHNNGMTEMRDGRLIIGEYGNAWTARGWQCLANLYSSEDQGDSWRRSDFLARRGTNKHVHVVRYSPLLDRLLVSDGDNRKRLWLTGGLTADDEWMLVNRFHIQVGGYTSVAEAGGRLLLGTDYQGGTNFLVATSDGRHFAKKVIPDPYRRSPIESMVTRHAATGTEIWANLPVSVPGSRCLLMYSSDAGESWTKSIEYSRAHHTVWVVGASTAPADDVYVSVQPAEGSERTVYRIGNGRP